MTTTDEQSTGLRHMNTLWLMANMPGALDRTRFGWRSYSPRAFFRLLRERVEWDPPMSRREKVLAFWEWIDLGDMLRYKVSDPLQAVAWWLVNMNERIVPGGEDGKVSHWSIYSAGEQWGADQVLRWHERPRHLGENNIFNQTYCALSDDEHAQYHGARHIILEMTGQARDALIAGDFEEAVRVIEAGRARIDAEVPDGWREPYARCHTVKVELDRQHAEMKAVNRT